MRKNYLDVPLEYSAPSHGPVTYGFGDIELGMKYRFFEETDWLPQVGVFPLLTVPTGDSDRDLGNGHIQAFLPLWLQKSFGSWTLYGGGGYGINPGINNHDWNFVGAVVQYHITEKLMLGGEIYRRSAMSVGDRTDTAFNIGTVIDFTENQHLLISAGRSIDGPTDFQTYVAYQFTFGP